VRARPGAPVATPLHGEELAKAGTRPDRWTLRTVTGRLERDGDPWAHIRSHARALGEPRRRIQQLPETVRAR
jgi:bifunctional non-homologous end joining protein LigD